MPRPIAERFWEKVDRLGDDDCWLWTAQRDSKGYGRLQTGSRIDGSAKNETATRVSYKLNVGEIPDGLCILHKCDNPPCVNPNHLFVGTRADNVRDAAVKGRLNRPDNRTHCKYGHELTKENTKYQGRLRKCRQCSRDIDRACRSRKLTSAKQTATDTEQRKAA